MRGEPITELPQGSVADVEYCEIEICGDRNTFEALCKLSSARSADEVHSNGRMMFESRKVAAASAHDVL